MIRVLALGDLAKLLETILRDPLLSDIWLEAEIASVSTPVSGHWYFSLKDGNTTLRANCWRTTAARLTLPRVGDHVRLHGRVDYYSAKGEVQFIIDDIVDVGVGVARAEYERLVRKYTGMSKQRPLPRFPQRIGVVTSRSGAAWHDVQATLATRFPCVDVILAHSSVQGESAPAELVAALEQLYALALDVVLVVRGGGASEDLAAFNHEDVIQAVLRAPMPVVSGVGHEVDYTVVDVVADVRAATPTMAAMAATPDIRELLQHMTDMQYTLDYHMSNRANEAMQRLDDGAARLGRAAPAMRIAHTTQQLEYVTLRLEHAIHHRLNRAHEVLTQLATQLSAVDPQAVLQRGFALVTDQHGQAVRRISDVAPHDTVTIQLSDGRIHARITEES